MQPGHSQKTIGYASSKRLPAILVCVTLWLAFGVNEICWLLGPHRWLHRIGPPPVIGWLGCSSGSTPKHR